MARNWWDDDAPADAAPPQQSQNWWDADDTDAQASQVTPTRNGQDPSLLYRAADAFFTGLPGRFGIAAGRGLMSLPGLPAEAAALIGNAAKSATGIGGPPVPIEESDLRDYGSRAWQEYFEGIVGKPNLAPASNEIERITEKAGSFAGGSLPFGPAAMVPALTATAGSEVGRATDQAGLTGGYGEIAGAIAGGMAPGVVRGQVTAGVRGKAPSNADLKTAAQAAYKQADDAAVVINQTGLTRLARNVRSELGRLAFRPKLQPRVAAVLDEVDGSLQAGNVTLQDVDTLRRVARNAMTGAADDAERAMASKIIERIDDFVDDIKPDEIVTGNAQQAAAALKEARDYWKRLSKSELIDDAVFKGELRAASTGTGGNTENAIRQNLRRLLDSPKKARQFTRRERALIERVVRGTASQNVLRGIATLSPDKGFFPLLVGGGAVAATGPLGAAIPAAGYFARKGAEALTTRNVDRLSEAVRLGQQGSTASTSVLEELRRRAALAAQGGRQVAPAAITYDEESPTLSDLANRYSR